MDYLPPQTFASEGAAQSPRLWRRILKVISVIIATAAILIIIVVCYENFRHHTTVAEVQGWIAGLPAGATRGQVKALFQSKGMTSRDILPDCPPTPYFPVQTVGYDPTDTAGVRGVLPKVERGWLWYTDMIVTVRFDGKNHVKGTEVSERVIAP